MTQEKTAAVVGVTDQMVAKWEKNERNLKNQDAFVESEPDDDTEPAPIIPDLRVSVPRTAHVEIPLLSKKLLFWIFTLPLGKRSHETHLPLLI
jgi:transcriptional regulator with XRE-family HTH domain